MACTNLLRGERLGTLASRQTVLKVPDHPASSIRIDGDIPISLAIRMAGYYSEREICEIVWLVASEHFYNLTNIGLNIHSDML